jgi:hypothetical protein
LRNTLSLTAALAAVLSLAGAAAAQPPGGATRVSGVVSAIGANGLTIRSADGKETMLGLAPGWTLVKAQPVDKDAIKPGAFVASANLAQADGVGRSLELRMFEPGSHAGEGNRPMTQPGAQPGQMMTNATVSKVSNTAAGLELDVAYPGGTRHLVVPPDVKVIASIPVDPATLKTGTAVTALATKTDDGSLRAGRIQIDLPR